MDNKSSSTIQLANFGLRLRKLRKERGYTNYEHFAYQNGFNRVQYGRYENGANISFKTLVNLLAALDISLAAFFAEGFSEEESEKENQEDI